MNIVYKQYTFNASAKTITFTGAYVPVKEDISLITALDGVNEGVVIYQFNGGAGFGGSLTGNVLTLEYNTNSMSNSDHLKINVENVGQKVMLESPSVAIASDQSQIPVLEANSATSSATLTSILNELKGQNIETSEIWEDMSPTPHVFYRVVIVRNQDTQTSTTTITRLSDNTVVGSLPSTAIPVQGNNDRKLEFFRYQATVASTGISVGDVLSNAIVFDTSSGTVVSNTWYNLTTSASVTAPAATSIKELLPNNAAQETGGNLAAISAVQGTTVDVAVTGDTAGTVSAKLRGINKLFASMVNLVGGYLGVNVVNTVTTNPVTIDPTKATGTITIQDTASTSAPGYQNVNIVSGTPTASSFVAIAVTGISSARIMINSSSAWTGTLSFEKSCDGGATWVTSVWKQQGGVYTAGTTTGNGMFDSSGGAVTNIRVRATAAITGSVNVTIQPGYGEEATNILNPIRIYDNSSGQSLTIKPASTSPLSTDTAGVVTLRDAPPFGSAPTLSRSTGLTTTVTAVKTTSGDLFGWNFVNVNSTGVYVKLFNAITSAVTLGSAVPAKVIYVPPGTTNNPGNVVFQSDNQSLQNFSSAISAVCVTGLADSSTTEPTTAIYSEILYK